MKRQQVYKCTDVKTLDIHATYTQVGGMFCLYDVKIGSNKQVESPSKGSSGRVSTIDYQLIYIKEVSQ